MRVEVRKDYLTSRRSVVSAARRLRPKALHKGESMDLGLPENCPFCPGNERMTPKEVLRIGGKFWKIRVFKNKYPAFVPDEWKPRSRHFLERIPGTGDHEVIVDTNEHYKELEDMSVRHISLAFEVFENRVKHLGQKYKYALLIKNRGPSSGASLAHSHAQLLAFDYMPSGLREELDNARSYYGTTGKNPFDEIIRIESTGPRFICENSEVICFSPYAPLANCEVMIVSKKSRFPRPTSLARAFKKLLLAMDDLFGPRFSYNFFVRYPPLWEEEAPDYYKWNMHIVPRLEKRGGFEFGTNDVIITIKPEIFARRMRRQLES